MKLRRRPRTYWLGRVLRGRRLDRNPLRRRSDRGSLAGPQVPESPQAGGVGRRLAGERPAVEPAAL